MSRGFIYLGGQLLRSYAIVGMALIGLFTVFAFVQEADFVGDGRYTTGDALLVVAMTTPAMLIDIGPFVAMLGTIYGLSVIARNNEIVPFRAAGVSAVRLVGVCVGAVLVFAAVLAVVEVGARPLHRQASFFRMLETSTQGNALPDSGYWASTGGVHVNIRSIEHADRPQDVNLFRFDTQGGLTYTHAGAANTAGSEVWKLEDVVQRRYIGENVTQVAYERFDWMPDWKHGWVLAELPLQSFDLIELREPSTVSVNDMALRNFEFFKRLFVPLSAVGFAIFAASFVLVLRPRGSHGGRMALGAVAAILVYLAEQIGTNVAILSGVAPALVASTPAIVIGIAGIAIIRRFERV
ncbi:MAG: LptF/LptG family permease [Gammaproteobacteria bacterium]|nr:LptF/LptG family permease [Gammaproteobacteria bacterium]